LVDLVEGLGEFGGSLLVQFRWKKGPEDVGG